MKKFFIKNQNMRPSSYNIVLQVDSEIGRYALINSYTHAFDIVNQDVYQYLKTGGTGADISDNTKREAGETRIYDFTVKRRRARIGKTTSG